MIRSKKISFCGAILVCLLGLSVFAQDENGDLSSVQIKTQEKLKKVERDQFHKRFNWSCDKDFSWLEGTPDLLHQSRLEDLIAPGEDKPFGHGLPETEFPKGMIVAYASGSCAQDILDTRWRLRISSFDILRKFLEVKEVLPGSDLPSDKNGFKGRFLVRKREYDDKHSGFNMFSWIDVSFEPVEEKLEFTETLEHLDAPPENNGALLKKYQGKFQITRGQDPATGRQAYLLKSEWRIWAANPQNQTLMKAFWIFAKRFIKKENTEWRDDIMFFLSRQIEAPQALLSR